MTAVVIWREHDAMHVVTDTAAVKPNGKVAYFTSKVRIMPHLRMAFAVRGSGAHIGAAQRVFDRFGRSFDDLRADGSKHARVIHSMARFVGGGHFDLFVAGFSEIDGPTSWMVSSHNKHFSDVKAFEVVRLNGALSIFPPLDGDPPSRFSVNDVPELMQTLRKRVLPCQVGVFRKRYKPLVNIGGAVQHTAVTRGQGVMTRIIGRWPDGVGKAINPEQHLFC